ncbi:unnamed protein product, partial [Wuchereria bancrofti]
MDENLLIVYSKYVEEFGSRNGLKPEIGSKDGTNLKFDYGIARNEISKWKGVNGKPSTSRMLTHPEVAEFIKKGTKRIVTDKQKTEANAEKRNADDLKLGYQQNSSFEFDLNSESKIKFPLSEMNLQKNANKLGKRPIPLYIATHYFKLSKEIEKYFNENFKEELSNLKKERAVSYGSNDEENVDYQQSSDTTLSYPTFNQPNVTPSIAAANFDVNLQVTSPSSYQSQLAQSIENHEFQPQNQALAFPEDEKQGKILDLNNFPKPGNCPPLNPLSDSLPHDNTDKSCGETLTGTAIDPNCACMYFVAERNEQGCATKFYILCYRFSNQPTDHIIEESIALQVPGTHPELNIPPQVPDTHPELNVEVEVPGTHPELNIPQVPGTYPELNIPPQVPDTHPELNVEVE